MGNYTNFIISNQDTGEVIADYEPKKRTKFYTGPRKYWRVMEMYDKALLLLHSKIGILIITYIRNEVDTETYRVVLNATHLGEDLNSTRESITRNIKKLVDGNFLHKEKRGRYFVNPSMFWSQNVTVEKLNDLKEEFKTAIITKKV